MDKNNYLYPIHLPCLPVIAACLWFPVRTVWFFLGEGKEILQSNSKTVKKLINL